MKYKNNEDNSDEYNNENENENNQKIKIIYNKQNNYHLKDNNPILFNNKGRNEKKCNNHYKINSMNNNGYQSTLSINTKIKNDPLKYITQYYLAKDKLNKIINKKENNKEILEDNNHNKNLMEESNKYKNINFQEILKIINDTKNHNLETKLNKFKEKKDKKIEQNNHLYNSKPLHNKIFDNYSPFVSFNPNLNSINKMTESNININNMNPSLSTTEVNNNHLYQSNNYTTSKQKKHKRVISLAKNRRLKNDKCFGNAERRLSSCKRMCRVCNKSFKDNENNNSAINLRYETHQSNSMSDRYHKNKEEYNI